MPTLKSKNKPIVITLGDPGGIGPEVTAKALSRLKSNDFGPFIILGHQSLLERYFPRPSSNQTFIKATERAKQAFLPGKATIKGARAAIHYLDIALQLLKDQKARGIVTAPLSKKLITDFLPGFQGHTEFLANRSNTKNVEMMFVGKDLRTVIVTRHIPLTKVPKALSVPKITETIHLTHTALKKHFKIAKPRIAVCGLNPHAGENGLMGNEEALIITPAIRKALKNNYIVSGPYPADTLFHSTSRTKFDAIVAMYHDQGLIPVKTLYFDSVVNLTIGLPFIRTSPAHGTAFDIAGKNQANEGSMLSAIQLADQLS